MQMMNSRIRYSTNNDGRNETLSGNPTVALPKEYLALSLQCPRRPDFVFNLTSSTRSAEVFCLSNPLQPKIIAYLQLTIL